MGELRAKRQLVSGFEDAGVGVGGGVGNANGGASADDFGGDDIGDGLDVCNSEGERFGSTTTSPSDSDSDNTGSGSVLDTSKCANAGPVCNAGP